MEHDIVIGTSVPRALVFDLAVRCICRKWPHAVIQDGTSGVRFSSFEVTSPPAEIIPSELFVYRDEASFESWERLGADAENVNTMIHLLSGDSRLTLVVDDPKDATTAAIVHEVIKALTAH